MICYNRKNDPEGAPARRQIDPSLIIADGEKGRNGEGGYKMVKKLSNWEAAILALALLFVGFAAGWFSRGNSASEPLRVETQRRLEPQQAVIALPAPTERGMGDDRININTADAATLATLPGIGEKRAADIVADREANGPFRFPEDITRVKGIGEDTLSKMIDRIKTEEEP